MSNRAAGPPRRFQYDGQFNQLRFCKFQDIAAFKAMWMLTTLQRSVTLSSFLPIQGMVSEHPPFPFPPDMACFVKLPVLHSPHWARFQKHLSVLPVAVSLAW